MSHRLGFVDGPSAEYVTGGQPNPIYDELRPLGAAASGVHLEAGERLSLTRYSRLSEEVS